MKIQVTQEDIALGYAKDCRLCPIARAARRATGYACLVDSEYLTLSRGGREELFLLPSEATGFVDDFDNGKPVAPFEFELEIK